MHIIHHFPGSVNILRVGENMNELRKTTRQDRQLVLTIKEAVKKKRLTVDDIVAGCEKNGEPVSVSTVRRIMKNGSEDASFRTSSIVSVAHFVLSAEEDRIIAEFAPEASVDTEVATADELRELLRFRESQIVEMRFEYAERSKERAQEVEFLKVTLEQKETENTAMRDTTKRQTHVIIILGILLFLFMVITIGYLGWDLTQPAVGAFQWETSRFVGEAVAGEL